MTVAKVGRRQSRRTALFLLYQWDLTGQPLASLYDGTPDDFALEPGRDDRRARARRSTSASRPPPTRGAPTGSVRSSATSCASAVYELEEGTVPAEVAINEAVVLAKRYATEDAARLVNGILGRIQREDEA